MKQNESKKVKGLYNSSITRVRPFFKALIGKDKTGESWLLKLLKATPLNQGLVNTLCEHPSGLLDDCLQEREYYDKILGKTIKLEECFEYSIPPSYSFLEWALMNPEELTWPEDGKKTFGSETQYKRECLFGYHGKDTQKEIMKEGFINILIIDKTAGLLLIAYRVLTLSGSFYSFLTTRKWMILDI